MTYKFHTLFLECKALLNNSASWTFFPVGSNKELLAKLDKMLEVFPEHPFNDLLSIHLTFDDTVRLVIDCAPNDLKLKLVKRLFNEFSVVDTSMVHGIVDKELISKAEANIEVIRKDVLLKYYTPTGENEDLVKVLMKDIYNIKV